jgi:hypothetical protein
MDTEHSLRTQNRQALDQLRVENAERRQWLEENQYLLDADIEHRSADEVPDICYRVNENALVEEEPGLFTDEQLDFLGECVGQLISEARRDFRHALLESERDLIERFGSRLQSLEAEVKALRTGPRIVRNDDAA